MNVLILAAGNTNQNDLLMPTCLTEIDDKPILQIITENCQKIDDVRLIFAINEQDIKRFSLDKVCQILEPKAQIIAIKGNTQGAACTALLTIDYINNDDELLILAANEKIGVDFNNIVQSFRGQNLDAGTIVFSAIHPRYSYVRLNVDGFVEEVAEKRPISRFATAGFFWFKQGSQFINAAQSMLLKRAEVSGNFFISPTLNELILKRKIIGIFEIEPHLYRPLKKDQM